MIGMIWKNAQWLEYWFEEFEQMGKTQVRQSSMKWGLMGGLAWEWWFKPNIWLGVKWNWFPNGFMAMERIENQVFTMDALPTWEELDNMELWYDLS